ncbi:MAG: CAP domain-containing protein [Planctomycetota bacterium]|jgi:hypothetical protein
MRALVVLSLLAASLTATEKGIKGKRVKIDFTPGSQLAKRHPVHTLGDVLELGGKKLEVVRKGNRITVGRKPVRAGKIHKWRLGGRNFAIRFVDDAGTYHSGEAIRFNVGGHEVRILDANCDGRYEIEKDVFLAYGSTVACPLEEELVLLGTRVRIWSLAEDGLRLRVNVDLVHGESQQRATVAAINWHRVHHGLPHVDLDQALSRACTAHAKYLALNNWTGLTDPHAQNLGPKGASKEGAEAARSSVIQRRTPKGSVSQFWRTFYHRIPLMAAGLRPIGVNAEPGNISVVHVAGYSEGQRAEPWIFAEPVCVPADGSTLMNPRAVTELPKDPVPNLGERGACLMLMFRTPVTEFGGELIQAGKKRRPVKVLVANAAEYFGLVHGLVPEQPLKAATWYEVRYRWKKNGQPEGKTVRFRTQ